MRNPLRTKNTLTEMTPPAAQEKPPWLAMMPRMDTARMPSSAGMYCSRGAGPAGTSPPSVSIIRRLPGQPDVTVVRPPVLPHLIPRQNGGPSWESMCPARRPMSDKPVDAHRARVAAPAPGRHLTCHGGQQLHPVAMPLDPHDRRLRDPVAPEFRLPSRPRALAVAPGPNARESGSPGRNELDTAADSPAPDRTGSTVRSGPAHRWRPLAGRLHPSVGAAVVEHQVHPSHFDNHLWLRRHLAVHLVPGMARLRAGPRPQSALLDRPVPSDRNQPVVQYGRSGYRGGPGPCHLVVRRRRHLERRPHAEPRPLRPGHVRPPPSLGDLAARRILRRAALWLLAFRRHRPHRLPFDVGYGAGPSVDRGLPRRAFGPAASTAGRDRCRLRVAGGGAVLHRNRDPRADGHSRRDRGGAGGGGQCPAS